MPGQHFGLSMGAVVFSASVAAGCSGGSPEAERLRRAASRLRVAIPLCGAGPLG